MRSCETDILYCYATPMNVCAANELLLSGQSIHIDETDGLANFLLKTYAMHYLRCMNDELNVSMGVSAYFLLHVKLDCVLLTRIVGLCNTKKTIDFLML